MSLPITNRQMQMLSIIYDYIGSTGYPPTFEEMRQRLGVKSNQSVVDLLNKLDENRLIKKNQSSARSLAILPAGYQILGKNPLVPFLGIIHAGNPISYEDFDGQWQEVPGDVALFSENVFIVKVSGDSMINAGINDQDIVLVKSQEEFVSGDIVLADIAGESTIKRFISEDKPPYLYLKPENPKYPVIFFTNQVTLKGKVISIFNNNQMISAN